MENLEERETDASEVVSFAVVVFLLLLPLLLLPILLFPLLFYKCSTKCIITGLCIIFIILIAMIALIVKFKMWTAQAWFSTTTISRTYFFAFGSKYLDMCRNSKNHDSHSKSHTASFCLSSFCLLF